MQTLTCTDLKPKSVEHVSDIIVTVAFESVLFLLILVYMSAIIIFVMVYFFGGTIKYFLKS